MPVCAEARGPWQCLSVASLCILRSVHFYLMCVDVLSPCMALHYVCLVPQGTRRGALGTGITDGYDCHVRARNIIQAL